jgi:hypothetical protein
MKFGVSGVLSICVRVGWILTMLGAVVIMTQTANAPFVYGGF